MNLPCMCDDREDRTDGKICFAFHTWIYGELKRVTSSYNTIHTVFCGLLPDISLKIVANRVLEGYKFI